MKSDFNTLTKNSVVLQTCRWQCGAVARTDTLSLPHEHGSSRPNTLLTTWRRSPLLSPHISPSFLWCARPSLLSSSPILIRTVFQMVPPRFYVCHCAFEQFPQSVHIKLLSCLYLNTEEGFTNIR